MIRLYFTDYFGVTPEQLDAYGAFNISLLTDLPLFIDPFLLFNSKKREYRQLHEEMIQYLRFLRDKAADSATGPGLNASWYRFLRFLKRGWAFRYGAIVAWGLAVLSASGRRPDRADMGRHS